MTRVSSYVVSALIGALGCTAIFGAFGFNPWWGAAFGAAAGMFLEAFRKPKER